MTDTSQSNSERNSVDTAVPHGNLLVHRRMVLGLAAAGVAAGAGVAWWRGQASAVPVAPASAPLGDAFWAQRWETPQGSPLPMRSFFGRPILLNFWATWCPPCIEELPLINTFYRQNKANGWQVLGLAVDKPSPVRAFLKKTPLDFPVAMAGLSGVELARSLGNLAGGLPFSVVVGSDGGVLHRKLGRLTSSDLDAWARLK